MHALRSGGCAASTRGELAPPWTPQLPEGPKQRRPGSSAAPWLTEARRTTHSCLLAHMQLSKSGPELPGLSKSDSKPIGDCEHRFDLVAARAVTGGEAP